MSYCPSALLLVTTTNRKRPFVFCALDDIQASCIHPRLRRTPNSNEIAGFSYCKVDTSRWATKDVLRIWCRRGLGVLSPACADLGILQCGQLAPNNATLLSSTSNVIVAGDLLCRSIPTSGYKSSAGWRGTITKAGKRPRSVRRLQPCRYIK